MRTFGWPAVIGLIALLSTGCYSKTLRPTLQTHYSDVPQPPGVDYGQLKNWAAHPDKNDPSDQTPPGIPVAQKQEVDVFFIHPTTYTGKPDGELLWNGDVLNEKLNERTDKTTILLQASAFNGAGNVYAPRYRQAHLASFYTSFKADHDSSLQLAYNDVKTAFKFYLEHYNNNKPFIIASHSQGTVHAVRLIQEMIDGKELQERLVAAYLIGMPVSTSDFKSIPVCKDSSSTGCVISWCTYAQGYYPLRQEYIRAEDHKGLISVNPLNWSTDTVKQKSQLNLGGTLRSLKKTYPGICNAQNHQGLLWIDPPKFPGSFLIRNVKNFHIGDINLFYLNIRRNAALRSKTYLNANH